MYMHITSLTIINSHCKTTILNIYGLFNLKNLTSRRQIILTIKTLQYIGSLSNNRDQLFKELTDGKISH